MQEFSLLYPGKEIPEYQILPEDTAHDLAVDVFCSLLSEMEPERKIIRSVMTHISGDPSVIRYRCDIFEDVLRFPQLREQMRKLLDRVDFLKTYGSFGKESDASGVWDLVHRLDEMNEYIQCVQEIYTCLNDLEIQSEGFLTLKEYVRKLYEDAGFSELKKDIDALKVETSKVKSVTLGVNLNDRYEPAEVGIVSINSKPFTKSGIVANFCDFLNRRDEIQDGNEWKNQYTFRTPGHDTADTAGMERAAVGLVPGMQAMALAGMAGVSNDAPSRDVTQILDSEKRQMQAVGLYNMKLAQSFMEKNERSDGIVGNDLDFDAEHRIYILTGANRGGKTTITQAVGMAFLLAQGGIYVPAGSFAFSPADNIFTHYPADENQTMDLGRLGEESKRFREIFIQATPRSLLLLNESFSTTSFEEGFFIARDVVRILLKMGVRTIFNTHMHKLAREVDRLNEESSESKAASLITETEDGKRSYRLRVAPPEGLSYAHDIAEKYGVTYEMLEQAKYGNGTEN